LIHLVILNFGISVALVYRLVIFCLDFIWLFKVVRDIILHTFVTKYANS